VTVSRPALRRPLHEDSARSRIRHQRLAAAVAAAFLIGELLAAAPVTARQLAAASPVVSPGAEDPGVLQPGIQYEDAMAHEHDRIAFRAGGRVTVGYRPQAGDAWAVDGRSPRALPAGAASGRELLDASATGGESATLPASAEPAPADQPDPGSSAVPVVDGASAALPLGAGGVALDGTRLRRQVFGFLPYWEVNDAVLNYDVLSTIAYFSVGADRNGNLLKKNSDGSATTGWAGWTSSRLTTIINAAHAKGTRVVLTLSVFAWSSGQAAVQGALLGSATARLNLAKQAAAAVHARGADGINLDFEPIASGYADEFTAFVRTMRAELNKQAPGYQLTFDTTGRIGNYPIEDATASGAADAIFIMGYDYRTSGSSYAGSIDPLSGPAYDLQDTIVAFSSRVPASKLILGVPWYGRAWSTVTSGVNGQNQSGAKFGGSNSVIYDTARDYAAQHGSQWDSREQTSWVVYKLQTCTATYGCVTSWRQLYFDDPRSIKLRYDLVNRAGLRGAGIWALGYDANRPEMREALGEKFLNDTTIPLAGVRKLASTQTAEAFPVSWIGLDESGIADYDVQVAIPGGVWQNWLVHTTATSATYAGADGYGFAFRARARDTHGNVGAWVISNVYKAGASLAVGGFGKVVASTVTVRSAPDTSATILTTADAGTVVAITGGPVSADGYTWYKVTIPVVEWAPVHGVRTDVWVATGNSSTTLVAATGAPNTTRVNLPTGVVPSAGARFVGLTPVRLVDTRLNAGLIGPFTSGAARTVLIAGRGGIPSNAVAVTGTITVARQTSAGVVSLGPSAATLSRTSVINAPKGDIRSVGVTVKLDADGRVSAMWSGAGGSRADLIFDVSGYMVPGSSGATFLPVAPVRLLDTRSGNGLSGSLVSSQAHTFAVAGRGGVPSGAVAVTGNVVAVAPSSAGYLYLGPAVKTTPATSTLSVPKGDIRAASVTLKLDAGRLGLIWKGAAGSRSHVVFDVTGYLLNSSAGATYYPLNSVRVVDSRSANGLTGPLKANVARLFQAAGRGTVPVDAVALTGGLAVVAPSASGWLSLAPGTSLGTASAINLPKGDIRANGFTVKAGSVGVLAAAFRAASGNTANLVLDLTGYFR
jgi:spore germination protein YaaH